VIVCLVTDRRRLVPDTAEDWIGCLARQARFAVEAGVDLIQVRERDLDGAALAAVTRALLEVCGGTTTRVIVNDRLDVALACGAHGVHLRADSMSVGDARALGPDRFLVGRSVHSVAEAVDSRDADYLIAGTTFPTASKGPSAPLLGMDGLQAIAEAVQVPVLAIGGVVESNVDRIARAGAAGCAAIGMFMAADSDPHARSCRAVPLEPCTAALRARFDEARRGTGGPLSRPRRRSGLR
jgi:thiamine-phosphate pyrophosphorylase